MNIQAFFDAQALNKLEKVMRAIEQAENFEANQMQCFALRAIYNSAVALDEMSQKQLNEFENDIIDSFIYKNWM